MDNTQFFYRTAIFTRKDDQVALADIYQPETSSPLDEWMGIVVSLADGKHTIQELVDYMGSRYQQVPAKLVETLHSVIERLLEGKIIQLSEDAVELPYYLASPIEELDIEKAIDLIRDDGYN
ncbi:MAG: hypothetical protein V7722_09620, partial [Porticoccus sp.]